MLNISGTLSSFLIATFLAHLSIVSGHKRTGNFLSFTRPSDSLSFTLDPDPSSTLLVPPPELPRGQFSMSYWVKLYGAYNHNVPVMVGSNEGSFDLYESFKDGDCRPYANFWSKGYTATANNPNICIHFTSWNFNTWTYSDKSDELKFYSNGQLAGISYNNITSTTDKRGWFENLPDNSRKLFLGSYAHTEKTLLGGFDNFALYNVTLSAAEIANKYSADSLFDPAEPGLVLFFDFDDADLASTLVADDKVSGAYPATLASTASSVAPVCAAEQNQCVDTAERTAPIPVCHAGVDCSEPPKRAPFSAAGAQASTTCLREESTDIFLGTLGVDEDGDSLSYIVKNLPRHGRLVEKPLWHHSDITGIDVIAEADLPYTLSMHFSALEYTHVASDVESAFNTDSFEFAFFDGELFSPSYQFLVNVIGPGAVPASTSYNRTFEIRDGNSVAFELDVVRRSSLSFSMSCLPTERSTWTKGAAP